ncbi:AMP-activated serine/threonine-protein kinase regulatory subunit [Irineochytrium annulatum]|nr:AMP-activated serine/threonine-protein kinase regulatory subunit [Irineochytrium annulatum]
MLAAHRTPLEQKARVLSRTFEDLLACRSRTPSHSKIVSIPPTASIEEALAVMAKHGILTLPITSRAFPRKHVYILSSLDLVSFLVSRLCSNAPSASQTAGGVQLTSSVEEAMTLDSEMESYRVFEKDRRDTLEDACVAFARKGLHRVLVTDVEEKVGDVILTQTDILNYVYSNPELYHDDPVMRRALSLPLLSLLNRATKVWSVREHSPALEAFRLMTNHRVAALPVVDDAGTVVDTLSSSDLRGLTAEGFGRLQGNVREFLDASATHSKEIYSLTHNDKLADAFELMVKRKCHRIWILDELSRAEGVVSQSDVIRAICDAPLAEFLP